MLVVLRYVVNYGQGEDYRYILKNIVLALHGALDSASANAIIIAPEFMGHGNLVIKVIELHVYSVNVNQHVYTILVFLQDIGWMDGCKTISLDIQWEQVREKF
jgi:hypothetical protein